MNTLADIESVEVALKQWLDALDDAVIVMQPGNYPDIKDPRLLFDLINMQAADFPDNTYRYDSDDSPTLDIVQEYTLTYQIDALYCANGIELIIRLLKYFKSGKMLSHGDYVNFTFLDHTAIRRIPFFKQNSLHYKTTVDIDFLYRCKSVSEVEAMENVTIQPCAEMDFMSAITINKP